jgi:hypothetical protein
MPTWKSIQLLILSPFGVMPLTEAASGDLFGLFHLLHLLHLLHRSLQRFNLPVP